MRGVDFVWVYKFPLPDCFPDFEFPFGPFYFERHWFMNNTWWEVLQDCQGLRFKVDINCIICWFSLCADAFVCNCQHAGVSCTHCRLIGRGKVASPSPFVHLVGLELSAGPSFVEQERVREAKRQVSKEPTRTDTDDDISPDVDVVVDSISPREIS